MRTGRVRLYGALVIVSCLISLVGLTPAMVSGQETGLTGFKNKLKQLLSKVQEKGEFTIEKIETNADDKAITITFTDSVDFRHIRGNMKFVPPVPVRWYESASAGPKSVLIRGGFAYGRQYTVILPGDFRSSNRRPYAKTTTSFTMPDMRSQVAYLEQGTVIERDSRQMLHVQIVNVNEVAFQAIKVAVKGKRRKPPIIFGWAI